MRSASSWSFCSRHCRPPVRRKRSLHRSMIDEARKFCLPDGIPRVLATPYPFQIFQQPAQVAMIHELNHQVRIIPLNKPVEKTFEVIALPHYNGHSFGRYEGDTLVIETIGF